MYLMYLTTFFRCWSFPVKENHKDPAGSNSTPRLNLLLTKDLQLKARDRMSFPSEDLSE